MKRFEEENIAESLGDFSREQRQGDRPALKLSSLSRGEVSTWIYEQHQIEAVVPILSFSLS